MTLLRVIDASVAVKWFLPEKDSDKADAIRAENTQLIAPDIFRSEVGSAITRQQRRKRLSSTEARDQCEELLAMLHGQEIFLMHSDTEFPDALMLSLQLNHAVADCLYLALAQRLDAPLITADAAF